jgi:hypothetical protein
MVVTDSPRYSGASGRSSRPGWRNGSSTKRACLAGMRP